MGNTGERQVEGLEHRVRETMEQYHMLEPGDRVIAAVSGGADSVCLLSVVMRMEGTAGNQYQGAPCPSRARGKEADRDADFVRSLCEGLCPLSYPKGRCAAAWRLKRACLRRRPGVFCAMRHWKRRPWTGKARTGQRGQERTGRRWAHGGSADGGPADGDLADGDSADGGTADGDSADGGLAGSSLSPVKIAVAHYSRGTRWRRFSTICSGEAVFWK